MIGPTWSLWKIFWGLCFQKQAPVASREVGLRKASGCPRKEHLEKPKCIQSLSGTEVSWGYAQPPWASKENPKEQNRTSVAPGQMDSKALGGLFEASQWRLRQFSRSAPLGPLEAFWDLWKFPSSFSYLKKTLSANTYSDPTSPEKCVKLHLLFWVF